MSAPQARGPLVIDTDVFGANIVPGSKLAAIYEPIIVGRPAFISFQTAAELRYGALRRDWDEARMRNSKRGSERQRSFTPVPNSFSPTPNSASIASGSGMRFISVNTAPIVGSRRRRFASASLVSNDGIFNDGPGLAFETAPAQ